MKMRQLFACVLAVLIGAIVAPTLPGVPAVLYAQRRPVAEPDLMRVGDRIILTVEGEKALTDSFTVAAGPSVELPVVGIVSLAGVRQRDLETHLTAAIAKFYRSPIVHVKFRSRIRLSVLGEVNKPGFYDVPTDALLSDVITLAGGPAKDAKLDRMRLERGDATLLEGVPLQKALDGGASLTQLGVQSGDRLFVKPPRGGFVKTVSLIGTIIAIPLSIVYLLNRR